MKTAEPVCRLLALIVFALLHTITTGVLDTFAQERSTPSLEAPLVPPSKNLHGDNTKDNLQAVMARAESFFKKAEAAYAQGKKEEARKLFDDAVDVIILSGINLRANPSLDAYYTELVERIASFDLPKVSGRPAPDVPNLSFRPSVSVHPIAKRDDQTKPNVEKSVIDEISNVNENELAAVSPGGIRIYGKYDFDFTVAQPVLQYINFFVTGRGRSTMEAGLHRSGRYRHMAEKIFKEEKVPRDLIWLAQAESVWKPNALSRAAAKGIWQFIPSTGTRYGLAQTAWIDERSNPEKSTRAAARYLRWLYEYFAGDWMLAMAAYNSGEGRIGNAIAKCGYADFWELYHRNLIPQETRNYVPIILAITIVSKNQERYGFHIKPDAPVNFEIVTIPDQTDLKVVADLINIPYEVVQDLNPELRRGMTPPDRAYALRLPKGFKNQFELAYAQLPEDERVKSRSAIVARNEAPEREVQIDRETRPASRPTNTAKLSSYKVRRGDTLSSVARRHGVSTQDLARINRLSSRGELLHGQSIQIPANVQAASRTVKSPSGRYASRYVSKNVSKTQPRVKKADKLSKRSAGASKSKKASAKKSTARRRR